VENVFRGEGLEERLARLEGRVEELSKRLDDLSKHLDNLRNDVNRRFTATHWESGIIFLILITLIIILTFLRP